MTKIQTLKFHDNIAGNKLEMPRKMFELRCHVRHFSIVPHYQWILINETAQTKKQQPRSEYKSFSCKNLTQIETNLKYPSDGAMKKLRRKILELTISLEQVLGVANRKLEWQF